MKLSSRSQTPPFYAMDVLSEAKELERSGRDIIHMEVGEPSHPAPRAAQERLRAEMAAGAGLGYTSGLGIPELRAEIAQLYRDRYGIELDPARVVVTAGSSAGFILSFLALFETGGRLGMVEPGYPCYRNVSAALGIEAVALPSTLEDRYQPTPALLDKARSLDGLLIASPSNPTGTMIDRERLAGLVAYCQAANIALISDEIYHGITYDAPAASVLEFTQEAIVINSFSKYWSMTGWRIGWMIVPERFVRTCQNLAQNLFICPSHASQVAALGALSPEGMAEVAPYIDDYAASRAALVAALPGMGFSGIAPSDGAFYIYADISGFGVDAQTFCQRVLHEAGVAITPGLDFDPVRGKSMVRLSYAQRPELIDEGIARMARMLSA
ncbi:aminotransferase class I/II-fold pyridoxal phosphate-dependent enzyme [Rhodobacteraceae bacterium NNCM2]|nr:aminotransferase class I/II-fold pyridoxal phosphate-dependent enzyme [Coraliihabitans acroporae]